MKDYPNPLQITRPGDVRRTLGLWLRSARQRLEWTQPILASRSGVPVATLSRLEREGEGSIDSILRVLQAMGRLDYLHVELKEQLRMASIPQDLKDLGKSTGPRQRVRLRKAKQESS